MTTVGAEFPRRLMRRARLRAAAFVALVVGAFPAIAGEEERAHLRVTGDHVLMVLHAVGTQNYACQADASGSRQWVFEAPQADLFLNGQKVGHHDAGPTWEYDDGSRITGQVVDKAAGADAHDVPWLRLVVTGHAGAGAFNRVGVVLRTETDGGLLQGACDELGVLMKVPYQATYVFILRS